MERSFTTGCRVVFFDSLRQKHEALVTNWFHGGSQGQSVEDWLQSRKGVTVSGATTWYPCCNVVYASSNAEKNDPYGRQLERNTSVPHGDSIGRVGMYYLWPDEVNG